MKRLIVGNLIALAALAGMAASVDADGARTAAQAWIDGGYSLRTLTAKTVENVERTSFGRESAYIARLADGGAVILPADDRIDPVIAFSPSVSTLANGANSPLCILLERDIAARMAAATNAPVRTLLTASRFAAASATTAQTAAQRRWAKLLGKANIPLMATAATLSSSPSLSSISDLRVAPLVQSRWSQTKNSMYSNWGDPCFNYHTPGNSPCGCVATAMAQLMRYHRYPASVVPVSRVCRYNGTDSSFGMMGGNYDYDAMPLVPEAYSGLSWYAGGATEAQRQAIGKLTYDCGVAAQMSWTASGGSAGGAAVHGPLKEIFGYASAHTTIYASGLATAEYRDRIIQTNLDAGYPVMLSITGNGGHEILADGYGYSDTLTYTHLNMGFANEEDIWYALPDIGKYNAINGIIYNVFPQESGEIVSGRVVDSSGNPIGGATVAIRKIGASSTLKTMSSRETGVFGFVVPSSESYVVTATFASGAASVSATTGASEDSEVTLNVGCYTYYSSSEVVCGNVACGDLVLSSVTSVAEPIIAPNGGLFYPTTNVTINCATEGATIRYTLDGSNPTESSPIYTAPFTIDDDTTVKARAFKSGFNPSIVVPATFVYDAAQGSPEGDYYSRPILISGATGSYVIDDNTDYTLEENEAHHTLEDNSYSYQYRTSWYKWTAPGSGTMVFTTKFVAPHYQLPSAVAVYPDGASVPTSTDARLAMSRYYSSSGDYTTSVSLEVAQGTIYRIVGVPLYDMGGTFTLSWTGDLTVSATETVGTEVPVPHSWLADHYPSADSSTYEALANSKGVNGLTVWESYLAGLDPTNANSKLVVTIRMDGTTPIVEWNVTNAAAQSLGYTYKVLGSRTLGADDWTEKSDVSNRFFKVVLEKN